MLEAWRVFAQAGAWGVFNTGSQAEVLRAAGWPDHSRPYNLRHSVGIGLSESGVDLADVSGWLGHSRVQTTRSAYVPVLNSRMQRAAIAIEGRLNGWRVP
jgi:integrase